MLSYLIRRMLYMIPTIIMISIISFLLIDLPPGDFLTSYITTLESQGVQVTEERIQSLKQRYALDMPLYGRYWKWATNILHGDFGLSWNWNKPVTELLRERLPYTIIMSLGTLIFTYVVAIPIGIFSAVKKYTISDYIITTMGFLGLSTPNFLLALVLMFVFFSYFGLSIGGLFSSQYENAPWTFAKFMDLMGHLLIPIIVIGTAGTAATIRVVRGLMLDELGQDYVQTARSKGLKESIVITKHTLRIVLNPTISTIGWQLPRIISGAAITAIVLNLPTTGPLLLQALLSQDMYLAGSFLFLLATLTVIGTLLSDFLLVWLDPRIRYE